MSLGMDVAWSSMSRDVPTSGAYDKSYFDHGIATGVSGLSDYLSNGYLPDLWMPRMMAVFQAAGLQSGQSMLDFGCAAGYAVRCAVELGINATGLDVSSAALSNCDSTVTSRLANRADVDTYDFMDEAFDLVFAKDVLEHIPPQGLSRVVSELLRVGRQLFACVPIAAWDDGPYIDETAENDVTHVVRLSAESWCKLLGEAGRKPRPLPGVCEIMKNRDRVVGNLAVLV